MTPFDNIYEQYLKVPEIFQDKLNDIYNLGMQELSQKKTTEEKEKVLYKLIFIFSDKAELYYFMGYLYKEIDINRALMWFRMCFNISDTFLENLIDFTKILFDKKYINYIHFLNKTKVFDNCTDSRIKLLLGTISIFECKMEEGKKTLTSLLDTQYPDKQFESILLSNLGYVYGMLADYQKSIEYSTKAYKISKEISMNSLSLLDNLIVAYDYTYADNSKRFELCNEINDIYKNEILFDLKNRKKNEKIKIGYVSSDFEFHAVSNFILPIIQNHDMDQFDIYLFTQSPFLSKYFLYECDPKINKVNISNMNALDAACVINQLNIDILFDLNGFTYGGRLNIFAKNPAPIQISYIGYPNSIGLKSIKYRIADKITNPPNSTQIYNEQLLYLPKCFLLYKPYNQSAPVVPKMDDTVILGALNKENKNSDYVLDTWKTILKSNTKLKILIKLSTLDNEVDRTEYYCKKLEVEKDRLIIVNKCSEEEYVNLFTKVDILLDTFPYSGTTTSCNTLYNSIPIITMYNKDYHVHNVTASVLINSGFPELVSYNNEEYIQKVLDLSSDIDRIHNYKRNIHTKFMELMNASKFMKDYEKIMKNLYKSILS
jgi:predicted O-linked N-acetylglucosamine transferase (SPINDLY family)